VADGEFHSVKIVAYLNLEQRVYTDQGQLLANPRRVGVHYLAKQQLGADGDDFATHMIFPQI
jgi:hypothetical protein